MPLLNFEETPAFDENEIYPRCFIRAWYHTWPEPRNGLVMDVSKDRIVALFIPLVHRATRVYTIKASEVKDGKWKLLYSFDLETIGKVEDSDVDNGETDTQKTIPK